MLNWIMQLQLLLAALSAFLPLAPSEYRERIAEVLDVAAKALAAGGAVATNLNDLAAKLSAIRAEVETMAAAGRAVTADELDIENGAGPRGVKRIPRRAQDRGGRRLSAARVGGALVVS